MHLRNGRCEKALYRGEEGDLPLHCKRGHIRQPTLPGESALSLALPI
jgi:hypothetical protein